MQVFKVFFKVIQKNIIQLSVYVFVFIGISLIFVASAPASYSNASFEPQKSRVAIFNQDGNSALVQGILDYMDENTLIISVPDNDTAKTDALFYHDVSCILTIPEGFTDDFMKNKPSAISQNHSTDNTNGLYIERLINRYLNTAAFFVETIPTIDQTALAQKTKDALSETAVVTLVDHSMKDLNPSIFFYYRYMAYALLAVMILGMSAVMMSFNQPDLKLRNQCAPTKLRSFNIQLASASLCFALIFWGLMVVVGFVLYGVTPETLPYTNIFIVNSLLMTIVALSIGFLVSTFIKNYNVQSAVSNVVSLGLCFLSGVFVPQEVLGDTVNTVASFTPTHWYIKTIDMASTLSVFDKTTLTPILNNMLILAGFSIAIFSVSLMISKYKQMNN